jgi:hypothetical protein
MKVPARTVQYSIRGIPLEVDRLLRERAALRKVSLNRLVLDELTRATGCRAKKADFSDLAGKWQPDPGFDEAIKAQRRIDRKEWQ